MQGTSDPDRGLLDAAALCRSLVPGGSVEAFLADHRGELFPDELFWDLFPSGRGRPSIPAEVVAAVMVLQALEGLSDREAARALRDRISWKVAAGLALDDPGFDYSVLTYWRARLRQSQRPERVFEAIRSVVKATGVLAGRSRRALDATVLDDAVATQDTVTQLISAIRRVRRVVPGVGAIALEAHDYEAGAKPRIAWDNPVAKEALVSGLVNDAYRILAGVADLPLSVEQADAVGILALVAGQDVEPGDRAGSWRIARRVVPDRVISTVDPESRHTRKSPRDRSDGYKAHLAVEPETGIVTAASLTPANAPDGPTGIGLLADEPAGLRVLADSAYGSGEVRARLRQARHRQAIKPIPLQRAVPGGFTRDDFLVDQKTRTVTCPAGHTVGITPARHAVFEWRCQSCRFRARCTNAKAGRILKLNRHDDELAAARRAWSNGEFTDDYRRWRPMVERSIAWLVQHHHRRVPYRGVQRNQQWLTLRVAALNLRRLLNLGLTRGPTSWNIA